MVDIAQDSYEFTIELLEHPSLEIQNVVAPSTAYAGDIILVEYDVVNSGGQDTCYGRILNDGEIEMAGSRWEEVIDAEGTVHKTYEFPMPSGGNFRGVIQVGYKTTA